MIQCMWKKVIALLMTTAAARAADLPTGEIVDSVECALDSTQHYALYLPSNYTSSRQWSVILAFDGGARGRVPVERYRQAAEKYGYIVFGSLNSRNGPWEVSMNAAQAMTADVKARLSAYLGLGILCPSRTLLRVGYCPPCDRSGVFVLRFPRPRKML